MIVNTGISLRKPGESSYSRFRRFLIANQGIYPNYSSSRNALVKFGEITLSNSIKGLGSIEILTKIEDQIADSNSLEKFQSTDPISFHPRSIKNCDECARIGFHSEIYNLIWINRCPIHNIDLSSRCGSCNQIWPTASNLFKTDCKTCGVRISFTLLSRRGAFETTSKFRSLLDIVEFNYQALQSEKYFIREYYGAYSGHGNVFSGKYSNLLGHFTPSALLQRPVKTGWTREKLKKLGIETYSSVSLTFPALKYDTNSRKVLTNKDALGISHRVKIHILNSIYETHRANGITSRVCSYSRFNDKELCVACKAWHYFIGQEAWSCDERGSKKLSRQIVDAYWHVEPQLAERKALPRPTYPDYQLPRHICIEGNFGSAYEEVEAIQIPYHALRWMYYCEVLICYSQAYLQLAYIDECENQNRTSLIDVVAYAPSSIKYGGLLRNPYYINAAKGLVSITVPKALLQPKLALFDKLLN